MHPLTAALLSPKRNRLEPASWHPHSSSDLAIHQASAPLMACSGCGPKAFQVSGDNSTEKASQSTSISAESNMTSMAATLRVDVAVSPYSTAADGAPCNSKCSFLYGACRSRCAHSLKATMAASGREFMTTPFCRMPKASYSGLRACVPAFS